MKCYRGSVAVGLGCVLVASGVARAQDQQGGLAEPKGRFEKCGYVSKLDGAAIEYALWFPPDYDASRAWPLIVFLHGSGEGGDWAAPTHASAGIPVRTAKPDLPFLVVSPLMRGTWSINGPAERDVLDTIADVQSRANVDPDRIHLTGLSLGAFAGWALAAHRPDRFASLSVFAGGGQPETVGNLRHVPTWAFHGTADDGVPISESVRLVEAMKAADLPIRYTPAPGVKHNCWSKPYASDALYGWMAGLTRVREPRRITYTTRNLRHNQAYWAAIDAMVAPEKPATIDTFAPSGSQIYVHAENVARLILRPPPSVVPPGTTPEFFVDGQPFAADAHEGGWALNLAEATDSPLQKRHGLSGPIQDVYWEPFVIVTADSADPRVAEIWSQAAHRALQWTSKLTFQNFTFVSAGQVTPELIQSSNLICFGNPETHSILAQVADRLPVVLTRAGLLVNGERVSEPIAGLVMIYPNPLNPDRYLVVCSGHPKAVASLAAGILRPPYLSPVPLDDLVVITSQGGFLLGAPSPNPTPPMRHMAPVIPPRGAVFDRNWQLPPSVVEHLTRESPQEAVPPEGKPTSAAPSSPVLRLRQGR